MKKNITIIIRIYIILGTILFITNSCKKDPELQLPTITTASVTNISYTTAISGGNITSDGGSPVTASGVCWNYYENPTISNNRTTDGTKIGNFTSNISGLSINNIYYLRAYATNSVGTTYGNTITFSTKNNTLPELTTTISNITSTSVTVNSVITEEGNFPITERGICFSLHENTTLDDIFIVYEGIETTNYITDITTLNPKNYYYVRTYVINYLGGIYYGNEIMFRTLDYSIIFNPDLTYETVTDIDNNIYKTITIGNQVWMAENLKVTHYRDGSPIQKNIYDKTGSYYNYNNNEYWTSSNGRLYNWYAVTNTKNIAPVGWHIPTDNEWTILVNYLNGEFVAGGKLKETGTLHWLSPNTEANNQSGFSALPSGFVNYDEYSNMGKYSYFWSVDESSATNAWSRYLFYGYAKSYRASNNKDFGFSVRCIKD